MAYDVIGSIAILKFPEKTDEKEKKETAKKFLKESKSIKSVYEKKDKIKGRLRLLDLKYLAGKKSKETLHTESACLFKLNIEKCYFSPRMSNDRLEVAKKIKNKDKVLVMFCGVAPYPIVIAKKAQARVTGIELGKACCKYAKENVLLNKLVDKVDIIQGDVKRIIPKLAKNKIKFEKIIMARPNLKESFLKEAFLVSKKSTEVYYHGFGDSIKDILEQIKDESIKLKKKIKIISSKKIGDIAPYKHRFGIWIKLLN